MIKLTGNNAYFIPPKNRYGLSKNELYTLTEHDFSMVVNVKIEWDKMYTGTDTQEGGIIAKNGMHCGINSFKLWDGSSLIKAQYWVISKTGKTEYKYIWIDVKKNRGYMKVAMMHDKENKTIRLWVDGEIIEEVYEGEIIDYRDSWLWVGANNSLDNCEKEHRGFLIGEIDHISVFDEVLNDIQIRKTFNAKDSEDFRDISKFTAAAYTFKEENMTPYKIYDISNNGNHMVVFDNKWMDTTKELI